MAEQPVFSFVFDRSTAAQVFQDIGVRDLVLALLAGVPVQDDWEGCLVYEGPSPAGERRTACVGIRGDAAERLQEELVMAFERFGIPVPKIYEGGPEERQVIARAESGKWVAP